MDLLLHPGGQLTRFRVLTGEDDDPGRRGAKTPIALSQCALACPDMDSVTRAIAALRSSDEQLKARPESEKFYDWQSTYVEIDPQQPQQGRVLFGVAWYNEAFFTAKSQAFGNDMHQHMFKALGIDPGAVDVTHWRPVELAA